MKPDRINLFWRWFQANANQIGKLYKEGEDTKLSATINQQIDRIDTELPWEIGSGKAKRYSFSLTPEGNPRLKGIIDLMIAAAPELNDWEFHAFRQPRLPPDVIHLQSSNVNFSTKSWVFVPHEDPKTYLINLSIYDESFTRSDRKSVLKAVSIFLDQLLGEETVEEWIGNLEISGEKVRGKSYPMIDLPDYIVWARNRKTSPLRHD